MTGENDKYNYSKAAHLYPPFSYIPCSAKNYKIAPALTHIGIPPFFGLPQSSMAMLEQIRTIDKSRLGDYVGCLDDDVMDYIDEALGISVGLQDPSDTAQERPTDEPRGDVPDEMVLTLCGTCLKQFIYSPEHIVRRINRTQTKEPCMYCHVRDGYDYRIIHKKKRLGDDRY